MEEYSEFTVNNLRVVNIKNDSRITSFGVAMLAGSNFETPEVSGVAHFAEHIFFKGTEKRTYTDINKDFARFGAEVNAYTSNNEVYYYSVGEKSKIEDFGEVMLDMVFNATFPADEIEKERNVIIEEKQSLEDNPKSSFYCESTAQLFSWDKGHPVIGEYETIKSISRQDIIDHLDKHCNRESVVLICCGDVDDEVLKKLVQENVNPNHSFLKEGSLTPITNTLFRPDYKEKIVIEREAISQSVVSLVMEGVSPDHALGAAQQLTCAILGGGMYSMLCEKIREELGLCYAVFAYDQMIACPDVTKVSVLGYTSPSNIDRFILETDKILADVVENGFPEDIFECAKNNLITDTVRRSETSSGKSSGLIEKAIFNKMGDETDLSKLEKVTIEDCNLLIKMIMKNDKSWVSMIPKGE
jgi:predicted Zn-dependent peptidase